MNRIVVVSFLWHTHSSDIWPYIRGNNTLNILRHCFSLQNCIELYILLSWRNGNGGFPVFQWKRQVHNGFQQSRAQTPIPKWSMPIAHSLPKLRVRFWLTQNPLFTFVKKIWELDYFKRHKEKWWKYLCKSTTYHIHPYKRLLFHAYLTKYCFQIYHKVPI